MGRENTSKGRSHGLAELPERPGCFLSFGLSEKRIDHLHIGQEGLGTAIGLAKRDRSLRRSSRPISRSLAIPPSVYGRIHSGNSKLWASDDEGATRPTRPISLS
jgi:hypothetical protein